MWERIHECRLLLHFLSLNHNQTILMLYDKYVLVFYNDTSFLACIFFYINGTWGIIVDTTSFNGCILVPLAYVSLARMFSIYRPSFMLLRLVNGSRIWVYGCETCLLIESNLKSTLIM